ncbi:hypothetical protein pW4_118 [Bacillus phage pW4]|uniref:Uncharacterized protein n=1 Tax=Bacillus phage pW4 TaxID=2500560 RepID=A0A3T0IIA4_9CAUD|nr:hypothetical protein PP656_gp027 [Bacillus phage pW4]AZU99127.1 hypothetical protein pW4_118 [Bacillus phage pW4]
MNETKITVERLTPAGYQNGIMYMGDFFFNRSAKFTEEEVSTLKTMISNFSDDGSLTVFELYDRIEIEVEEGLIGDEIVCLVDTTDEEVKVNESEVFEYIKTKYPQAYKKYIGILGGHEFCNEDDNGRQLDLMYWLRENYSFHDLKFYQMVGSNQKTFLTEEDAQQYLSDNKNKYADPMISEAIIENKTTKALSKLLSLLNL